METSDIPQPRVYKRSRSKIWQISYRNPAGERVRKSSGTEDEAEAWKILRREYRLACELSFQEVVLNFFETRRDLKPNTLHSYRNSLRVLDPFFRRATMADIRSDDLKRFVAERRKEVSDAAVKRDLAFLSSLYTHAQRSMPGAPEVNPVRQLDKRHLKEKKRTDWLTRAEFDRLERACLKERHRMVVTTGAFTGLRHAEMRLLEKRHINFGNREIQLPGEITKNGKPRTVPLLPEFFDQFEAYCSDTPGNYVFSHFVHAEKDYVPYTSFQGFFRLVRTRAGLPNITLHGLRHTFASWWVQSGGDVYALKEILGHASMQMVERYSHLDSGATHRAAEEISGHTFGTLGQKPGHTRKKEIR